MQDNPKMHFLCVGANSLALSERVRVLSVSGQDRHSNKCNEGSSVRSGMLSFYVESQAAMLP